jgi:hypothetical protein
MLTLLFTINFHMSTSKLMRSGLQFEQAQLYTVAAAVCGAGVIDVSGRQWHQWRPWKLWMAWHYWPQWHIRHSFPRSRTSTGPWE